MVADAGAVADMLGTLERAALGGNQQAAALVQYVAALERRLAGLAEAEERARTTRVAQAHSNSQWAAEHAHA